VTFFLSFFILGIALLVDLLDPIEVYRPTTAATDEEMERFYQDLSQAVKQVPKGDMLLVMGDFNAKVGSREPSAMSSTVGLYGLAETNEAGEQLEDVRLEHQLALANTAFKQHPRRLHTWTSPDGNTRNQIDYINCAKMENKLDYLSHVSGSRLRHRSSVACGYAESQAGKKTQTAQHSASESRGTQGSQISTVCSRGDQQVFGIGGCTESGHPRRSLEWYQDTIRYEMLF